MSFDCYPNKVIPEVLAGINGILKSASKSPSVKRFVYTSSSTAATTPKPNKEFHITNDLWNEDAVKAAWAPPPYEDERKWAVYRSSKTEAEKAYGTSRRNITHTLFTMQFCRTAISTKFL
jgi:hypothetical protein